MAPLYVDVDEVLAGPFYAFGALLIALPSLDFVTSVLPLNPSDIQWRFATFGLLSNFLLTPLLGVVILIAVAAIRQHLVFQRILATVNGLVALLLACLIVLFVLDIVQLNATISPNGLKNFQNAAFKAIVKHVTAIPVLLSMAIAGWRASAWTSHPATSERG